MTAPTKHGCHNHEPYKTHVWVQDGYVHPVHPRVPVMSYIENPMTKDCQYTREAKTHNDPRCTDCIWKKKEEND